jgi:hypothetical protein
MLLLGLVALGVGLDEDQPVVERERLLLSPSTPALGASPTSLARSRSGPGVAN